MTKTIICDIDGTILNHKGDIYKNLLEKPEILNGVIEKLKEWDKNNYKIILTTERKEGTREQTKEQLKLYGINYDELIMGLPNGERILINNKKEDSIENTAYAYNVIRNQGLCNLNLELINIEKKIEKPWGYEEIIEYNKNYIVKKIFIKNGYSSSTQLHRLKTETIVILKGALKIYHGDDINSLEFQEYEEGDYITIKPYKIHKMFGITDCIYLETSTNELCDIIKLQDGFGRTIHKYYI
jgi:mannose-6-phosphate isomerase